MKANISIIVDAIVKKEDVCEQVLDAIEDHFYFNSIDCLRPDSAHFKGYTISIKVNKIKDGEG